MLKLLATSVTEFPSFSSLWASLSCSSFILLGRPKRTPRFRASARPAPIRLNLSIGDRQGQHKIADIDESKISIE